MGSILHNILQVNLNLNINKKTELYSVTNRNTFLNFLDWIVHHYDHMFEDIYDENDEEDSTRYLQEPIQKYATLFDHFWNNLLYSISLLLHGNVCFVTEYMLDT